MKWEDIEKEHIFKDGSKVEQRHQTHKYDCFTLYYGDNQSITLSKDHILQINIDNLPRKAKKLIKTWTKNGKIARKEDISIECIGYVSEDEKKIIKGYVDGTNHYPYVEDESQPTQEFYFFTFPEYYREVFVKRIPLEFDNQKIDNHTYWLPVQGIVYLLNEFHVPVYCNHLPIYNFTHIGTQECFCVSTDTGKYELNGLIHHNSVLTQNIILHCLEHRNEISLALIDIKCVEYTNFKGMKGIVGVANTVQEATEMLRIARAAMYKRNMEMAKIGIKQISEYEPKDKSGLCYITGVDLKESDLVKVKINNEEKEMTAADLVEYLKSPSENGMLLEAEVCLNGEDWIIVNENCCDYIYKDTMPYLLVICDELAELTGKSGIKTEEEKSKDAMRDEIMSIISSIAQLGRSSGILVQICTQKPNASVVPTILRSNPLAIDTEVEVVDKESLLND